VFDISNALLGAFFYCFAMVHHELTFLPYRELLLLVSTGSLGFSLYLAYVLKFVLNDFCLVCMGMYIVNIIIFLAAAKQVLAPGKRAATVEQKKTD
jgi:vitamin-K-epoxide reductase (warfarin-sensitive)